MQSIIHYRTSKSYSQHGNYNSEKFPGTLKNAEPIVINPPTRTCSFK